MHVQRECRELRSFFATHFHGEVVEDVADRRLVNRALQRYLNIIFRIGRSQLFYRAFDIEAAKGFFARKSVVADERALGHAGDHRVK
jgi:hypothetical protein